MDEERFGLVFMPVVGGNVDGWAGFEDRAHAVGGGGVGGEELESVGAVFGVDWIEVGLARFGGRAREEGEHFERFGGWG